MDWNKLINEFLNGDTDAIQAVFTICGFLVGIAGTYFVAKSFRQQTKINTQQYELNRIAGEKHRRAIRPNFQASAHLAENELKGFELILTNAIALDIKLCKLNDQGHLTAHLINSHNAWEPSDKSAVYLLDDLTIAETAKPLIIIQFKDEDETEYSQVVKQKGSSIYATFPKMVSKKI